MNSSTIFRFSCLVLLWVVLCAMLITRSPRIDFWVIFPIVASGIIVFVPLYKRYKRDKNDK